MASPIPSPSALRALRTLTSSTSPAAYSTPITHTQVRHATLLRRPKRPYTFTQLVTLTDGSSFVQRTTSPMPVYKATKDTRNTPLWNPSLDKLLNVEEDEAGKLAAFRAKFGRGYDTASVCVEENKALATGARKRMLTMTAGQGSGQVGLLHGSDQWGCYEARGSKEGPSRASDECCACQGWKEIMMFGAWGSRLRLARYACERKTTSIAQPLYTICHFICTTYDITSIHLHTSCVSM